jgi:hypothetical protein
MNQLSAEATVLHARVNSLKVAIGLNIYSINLSNGMPPVFAS